MLSSNCKKRGLSSLKGAYQYGSGWEGFKDFIISFEKLIPIYKTALTKVSYTIPLSLFLLNLSGRSF